MEVEDRSPGVRLKKELHGTYLTHRIHHVERKDNGRSGGGGLHPNDDAVDGVDEENDRR